MRPTDEQAQAIDAYLSGESLRIEALAGTGKTTTLKMLVRSGSPRGGKIVYTSFAKKVVADAKSSFPASCRVATNHSLAWAVGRRYQEKGRLQPRVTPHDVTSRLGWSDARFGGGDARACAYAALRAVEVFCQSAAEAIGPAHAGDATLRMARNDGPRAAYLLPFVVDAARELWAEMVNPVGTMPVTHDVYLKEWTLGNPRIAATTILLDEAQDSNPLLVHVLQRQTGTQLVIVGDRRQAIYGFRGSVDSMDAFGIDQTVHLTQSFRFGPEIAEVANAILADQCDSGVLLRGDPNQPGRVGPIPAPTCFLARTNASLVAQLVNLQDRTPNLRVGVVGGVSDLIKLVEGADALQCGVPTNHPDLQMFRDWSMVKQASEGDGYSHLRTLVSLVETYGTSALTGSLNRIRGNEDLPAACDVMLSTAHKAKGAEFEAVRMVDDFTAPGPRNNRELTGWKPEDGNLLYVAVTRARKQLDCLGVAAVQASLPGDFAGYRAGPEPNPDAPGDTFSDAGLPDPGLEFVAIDDDSLVPGVYPHPLFKGGEVEVAVDGSCTFVEVRVGGLTIFRAQGTATVGPETGGLRPVTIGCAELHVPNAAVG